MPVTPPTLLNDPYERAQALLTIAANQLEDPAERVWAAHRASAAVAELLGETVEVARAQNILWEVIGEILGTTRQATQQRFSRYERVWAARRRFKSSGAE